MRESRVYLVPVITHQYLFSSSIKPIHWFQIALTLSHLCTGLKKVTCNKPLRLPHSSLVIIFLPAELKMESSVQKVSKEALSFSQISTLKNLNIQRASQDSLVIVVVLITVILLFSEAGCIRKE